MTLADREIRRKTSIFEHAKRTGNGKMALCCLQLNLAHLIAISSLATTFSIYDTEEEAIAGFIEEAFQGGRIAPVRVEYLSSETTFISPRQPQIFPLGDAQ